MYQSRQTAIYKTTGLVQTGIVVRTWGLDMDTRQSSTGRFRGIIGTLGAVTGLVTAVVGLIAALVSIGAFGGDDDSDETAPTTVTVQPLVPKSTTQSTVPTPVTQTTVAPTTAPTTPTPSRASVTITYLGDLDGCGLGLAMTVGDRDFLPTGFSYQATSLLTGPQPYLIAGTISCPTIGQCTASGSGFVDVFEGAEFFVVWQNVSFGMCDVFLQA